MLGSLLGAVAGPVVQGLFGQSSANKQMKFQQQSQRMRYQWTMEDMKRAGLNPILAYKQGGGSSLPGARANISAPDFTGATTAKSLRSVQAAQADLLNQQQMKALEETKIAANNQATSALQARIAEDAETMLLSPKHKTLREAVALAKATESIGGIAPTVVSSARMLGALGKQIGQGAGKVAKGASRFRSRKGSTARGRDAATSARGMGVPRTPSTANLFE